MKWRLDVELGNESLYRIYKPSFLVEIDSQYRDEKRSDFFETDYLTLQSITQELESAIQNSWEVSCADFRYLMKYACACLYLTPYCIQIGLRL